MISSIEKAILVLKKWETGSPKLLMSFVSDHVRITSHGKVESLVDTSSVWRVGAETGDETRFDLARAASISYIDSAAIPEGYEPLADFIDESLSMAWEDGIRSCIVSHKEGRG